MVFIDFLFLLMEVKLYSAYSNGLEGMILAHWYFINFKSASMVVEAQCKERTQSCNAGRFSEANQSSVQDCALCLTFIDICWFFTAVCSAGSVVWVPALLRQPNIVCSIYLYIYSGAADVLLLAKQWRGH